MGFATNCRDLVFGQACRTPFLDLTGRLTLKGFAQFFAAAVQMGADGSDGHAEGIGDLLVATFFLMIEDEDGSLDVA